MSKSEPAVADSAQVQCWWSAVVVANKLVTVAAGPHLQLVEHAVGYTAAGLVATGQHFEPVMQMQRAGVVGPV